MGALGLVRPKAQSPESETKNRSEVSSKGVTSIEAIPSPRSSLYLRNYKTGGRQTLSLRALIKRMHPLGIKIALLHAPVSHWYSNVYSPDMKASYRRLLEDIARENDIPLYLISRQRAGLTDADYFIPDGRFDGHHILSKKGRAAFQHFMESQVIGPLQGRIDAQEEAGFSLSIMDEEVP